MSDEMVLRTVDDVTRLAGIAIASRLTKLSRVEEAAVILMTGHELGLRPMQSLRGIYVVDGKPTLSADMMVAVVRRSGLCESWRVVESTAERCTITTRRKGESVDATRTWTRADADRAGVTGKDPWRKYPATMLRHRCAADLARQEFSDVLLGLYDPDELDASPAQVDAITTTAEHIPSLASLGIEQGRAGAAKPAPSTWAADLAACSTLRSVRACYQSAASPEADTRAMCDDVRAWCAERGVIATAAEVMAILATLPEAALVILDNIHADEEREPVERIEHVARRVAKARGEWDAHSAETVAKIVARSYAHAAGVDLRTAGATLKRLVTSDEPEPPTTGTDGPRSRESAEDDGSALEAFEAARSHQGAQASAEHAWRETATGITAHVATLGARHIENSARRHLREIGEALTTHAVHSYAGRVHRLSHDGTSALPWDECVARVERWLREGPRVTTLAAGRAKRAA